MVPEESSNAAESLIQGKALSAGSKVSFDPDNAALLNVNPPNTQSTVTTITAFGTNENQDALQVTNIVATKNATVNGANVKTPIGKLQAQLLKRRHYAIYLHYVTETPTPPNPNVNPDFPCQNLPLLPERTPMTQVAYDNLVQRIQTGLNNIYTPQANVQFDVYPVQGSVVANGTGTCDGEVVPEQVHYDLNSDGHLQVRPSDPSHNPEENAIVNAIQVAHPPQMPPGISRQIHIYFVHNFVQPLRIADINIPPGLQVGRNYKMTFTFAGGIAPYQFNVIQNTLPPGSGLAVSTGKVSFIISGVPTPADVGGAYDVNFTVTSQQTGEVVVFGVHIPQIVAAPGVSPKPQPQAPGPGQPNTPLVGYLEAFATSIGGNTIFVDDLTPDDRLIRLLGHELGHTLNMNHAHENGGGTCIPNLPAVDSDYSDQNQLMWWLDQPSKQQTHIGIQQLWQMNGNLGSACHN